MKINRIAKDYIKLVVFTTVVYGGFFFFGRMGGLTKDGVILLPYLCFIGWLLTIIVCGYEYFKRTRK